MRPRLAGAGAFIDALPDDYRTELVESGMNLSGGQRQRLALARALLTKAPILVLDEPTSALDAHHERMIQDSLQSLKGKRSVVFVSHRIATVQSCDLICVLDRGAIVEQGTHAELIRRDGLYASMAAQQLHPDSALQTQAGIDRSSTQKLEYVTF